MGTDVVYFIDNTINNNSPSFDGGIKLGYQYYFDKEALGIKQAYGIGIGLYIGAGIPISGETYATFNPQDPQDPNRGLSYILKSSYIPIRTGIDINFLWDFWEKGNHTLGLSAGFRYKFSYYKNTEAEWSNSRGEVASEVNADNSYEDLMIHSFIPKIGLHYYYDNHQFEITTSFGISYSSQNIREDMSALFGGGERIGYKTQIINSDYLSFGYSYRF